MPYSPQEKAGLRFLKNVLSKVGYPEETTIDKIFFRKDGDKVTPFFTGDNPTVEDILEADIHDAYEDPVFAFAGGEANAMLESAAENTIFFIDSPDGNGRIEVNKDGIKPPMVDGRPIFSQDIKTLNKTKEILGDLLATFQEENGEYTAVKADLANADIYSRLMQKDENGNYMPLAMDTSKFASDFMQERLQAVADISKIIKGNNLYLRDEDGAISKVEMAKDGSLYRGEYDRESVAKAVQQEIPVLPDRHGTVAMFFMRMFQSIGIHWFDEQIAEQEEVEAMREEAELSALQKVDKYVADRQKVVKSIKGDNTKYSANDLLLSPTWKVYDAMTTAMVDPKSPEGRKLDTLEGKAYTYEVMGMLAGALSLEGEEDKAMRLLDGFTSGKKAWDEPGMQNFLQRGYEKFHTAMKAFEGSKDAFNAGPMKELLNKAVSKMAIYAGTLVPLDNRAIMLSKMAKEFTDYSERVPALKGAFNGNLDAVRGLSTLGHLVQEGLRAQERLANKDSKPREAYQDMGYYLAYKTAEQIVRVDHAYDLKAKNGEKTLPENSPTFIQMLGHFGPDNFVHLMKHSEYLNKNWLYNIDNPEPGKAKYKEDIEKFSELARDGYHAGSSAQINKIALGAAKELAKMYANVEVESDDTRVVVYQRNAYVYYRPQKGDNRVEALNPEDLSQEELEQATLNDGAKKTVALNNGEQPKAPEAPGPGLR